MYSQLLDTLVREIAFLFYHYLSLRWLACDSKHSFYCYRKGSPPTPHAGGWDKKLTVYSQDRHVKLFLDDGELGSARKMYVGLADAKFNEGKPRERQVGCLAPP